MRHGDYAIVAVAAVLADEGLTLAVGGVTDRPVSQYWSSVSENDIDGLLNDFAFSLEAQNDQHASAQYRKHLVCKLGKKVINQVLS